MRSQRRNLPGVLLLLLSALGFLISLLAAAALFIFRLRSADFSSAPLEDLALYSAAALALLVALLNLPAFFLSLRYLSGADVSVRHKSLIRPAALAGLLWFLVLLAGNHASQSAANWVYLAPLSMLAVAIPVWCLVELGRRGLPRTSALREWGTLTIGLTAAPLIIMIMEIVLVVLVALAVLLVLGFNSPVLQQLISLPQILSQTPDGLDVLENTFSALANEPWIAAAIFFVVGVVAPLIEETFKPLAVWLLLARPLERQEAFSLGLISGGAFALLESTGLVSQIDPDSWLPAVALRAATAVLHIGLSGLLGYGLASAWQNKNAGTGLRYLLAAAGLHGIWNTLALFSGFSAFSVPADTKVFGLVEVVPLVLMLAVFSAIVFVVIRINHALRTHLKDDPAAHVQPSG